MSIALLTASVLVALSVCTGAMACFLRGLAVSQTEEVSALRSTFRYDWMKPRVGWNALGISCLLRIANTFIGIALLSRTSSSFTIWTSAISPALLIIETILLCIGFLLIPAQCDAQEQDGQNESAAVQTAAIPWTENGESKTAYQRFSARILLCDAFILGASLAALRWWVMVEPGLHAAFFDGVTNDFTQIPNRNTPGVPAGSSLLHTIAITISCTALFWHLLNLPLWENTFSEAPTSKRTARQSWLCMGFAVLFFILQDAHALRHPHAFGVHDTVLSSLAPLWLGLGAFLSQASCIQQRRPNLNLRMCFDMFLGQAQLPEAEEATPPREETATVPNGRRGAVNAAHNADIQDSFSVDRHYVHRHSADEEPSITLGRKRRADTHSKLLALREVAIWIFPCFVMSAAVFDIGRLVYAEIPIEQIRDQGALPGGLATSIHLWWSILLLVAAGFRHRIVHSRIQERVERRETSLQATVQSLREEVSWRTQQLLGVHTVTSGLTNTLNREQVLSATLERILETVRADAGVVWLNVDFDRELSSYQPEEIAKRSTALDREELTEEMVPDANGALKVKSTEGVYLGGRQGMQNAAADNYDSAIPQLPHDWRIVRSHGFGSDRGQVALQIMDSALQKGGLGDCARVSQHCRTEVGDVHLAPLRLHGRVVGVLGATRWETPFEPAERRILEVIAIEVSAALRNTQLYQEARRRAERDGVTDLYNHRTMQEKFNGELVRARAESSELTIIMMDLNNFKFFNDTYGHPIGDNVLRTVAHCLRETCRSTDIIGRYGGDEFIALLPHTPARQALELCRRIEERIEREAFQHEDHEGRRIPIGLAFGAAVYPHDGKTVLELLSVADANLYEAKRGGAPMSRLSTSSETAELRQLKEVGIGGSFGVLDALVTAIDNKDHYTRRHSEDVTHWATLMARQLQFSFETQRAVRISGLLHDVGKIAVPDAILRKPGRLNDEEFAILQQHPVFGALIVKDVPNLTEVLGGIRHHHERFDGKGYPDRLKGEDIPMLGRLLAVPDCFSAMTTDRPYRKALSWSEALTEIERGSGKQFDPQMVDAFLEVMARIISEKDENDITLEEEHMQEPMLAAALSSGG